jgi:hypothetical protein
MNDIPQVAPAPTPGSGGHPDRPPTPPTVLARLKEAAAQHGEKALAELPATLRRLRILLLVAAISLPLFLVGVLAILARLVH